ncbi:MAG: hypothetical protein OXM61_10685 [Candidatus Poribacteria bacterium]|nr:hypothetical protein [Candidatus Poribacteria bacterium]
MPFDLNGDFIEESVIFEKALTEPLPCLLLNPNLPIHAINAMEKTHYIVEVEHENKMYKAIVMGYYRVRVEQVDDFNTNMKKLESMLN